MTNFANCALFISRRAHRCCGTIESTKQEVAGHRRSKQVPRIPHLSQGVPESKMSRGTGVFHPRSQEERHSVTSADSSAPTSNHRRNRGSRSVRATGDARPFCASHQAADTPAQRTAAGQHGETLRRVPWQQQQRTQDAPSRERFAVGSCHDRLLMCQPGPPPPPPPAARAAAAGSGPQPAQTDSSNTPHVLQQQAAGGSASTPPSNSMLAQAACIPGPSSDSVGSAPHTPWSSNSSSSSSSALLPPSPAPAAAGDNDQLLLPPRPQLSSALPQPPADAFPWPLAAQQRLGATLVSSSSFHSLPLTGALQSPASQPGQAVAAVSSSLSASLPSGGIWGGCRQDLLPPAGSLFGAAIVPQDRQSSMCVADNLTLFGSSAPGSGFMKPMPPPCQDQQLLSGSSSNSSLPWLAEPSWSGGQPCSPAGAAAAAATDATLAELLSRLAAATGHAGSCVDAAVHVAAAAPAAAHTHSGMSGLLPSCGLGTSLDSVVLGSSLDSYSTGLLSGCHERAVQSSSGLLASQQQLQLANNSSTLSFSDIRHTSSTSSMHTAHMPCSVPLSNHGHSLQGVPLLPSAAVQLGPGCQISAVAGMPLSNGPAVAAAADSNAMAAAVAQIKLQQLLAVEQIQQQLQEEVLRLLPLI